MEQIAKEGYDRESLKSFSSSSRPRVADSVSPVGFLAFKATEYIRWYNLRSYDRINAPSSFLKEMEKRVSRDASSLFLRIFPEPLSDPRSCLFQSGVSYHDAQVALAREWVGTDSVGDEKADTINITIPVDEKGQLNQMEATDGGQKIHAVKMPKTAAEAKEIVKK